MVSTRCVSQRETRTSGCARSRTSAGSAPVATTGITMDTTSSRHCYRLGYHHNLHDQLPNHYKLDLHMAHHLPLHQDKQIPTNSSTILPPLQVSNYGKKSQYLCQINSLQKDGMPTNSVSRCSNKQRNLDGTKHNQILST